VLGDVIWAMVGVCIVSIPLVLSVLALLDAAKRPEWVFSFCGKSRTLWVALCGGGILVNVLGIPIALWYLLRVRPVVRAVEGGRLDVADRPRSTGPAGGQTST
jgi:hypothetical protein